MPLITGRSNCRQNSGLSAPCSCSASRPQRSAILRIVAGSSSAKTPTRATHGGRARAITRAVSACPYRRPGRQKLSPIASVPASTAASASSSRLIPQILTRTISAGLPPPPGVRPVALAARRPIPGRAGVVHPPSLQAQGQRLLRLPPRDAAAVDDHVFKVLGIRRESGAPRADRVQKLIQGTGQPLLDLDVAHRALAVPVLELVDFGAVPVERVMVDEHGIAFNVARIRRVNPRRV